MKIFGATVALWLALYGSGAPVSASPAPLARAEAAVVRLAEGDFAAAAKEARAGLQETPDSPTLNLLAGAILLNTSDARGAQTVFEKAVKVTPNDALAYFGRGLALLARGSRKAALQNFSKAEQCGGDPTFILLARRYAQWLDGAQVAVGGAGLPDGLIPAQRALEGMTAFRRGNRQKAISELEAAHALLPGNNMIQPGGLLMRFEAAKPLISAAPRLSANHGLVTPSINHALSGNIQLEPDNIGASAAFASFDLNGKTLGLVNQRPFSYIWDSRSAPNGSHTLTVTLFDRNGVEMGKTTRRVRTFNANITEDEDAERTEQLRSALWQALSLRPDRCACAYTLGLAYRANGNLPQARRWFLRAAALQPNFKDVRAQLAAAGGLNAPSAAIWGGLPSEKVVALTFDDGPKPGMTEPLLEILSREQAPATFFVIGRHITDYPDLARQIVAAGMELANHSYTHSNLTRLSEQEVARELLQTQAAIQAATGKTPRFVRPPGGNWNNKVAEISRHWGLIPCMWTVDVYGSEVLGAQQVADAVLSQVRPGSIILMHNGKMSTLQALPTILRELKKRGYTFATVDTMERRLNAAKAAERAAALRNANPNVRRIE